MVLLIKNPYDFYKVLTFKWHMSEFETSWNISLQISYLSEATVANFQNNGKIQILCVDNDFAFGWETLFKQSNGLISVIWTLLHWKQRLRDDMLTLKRGHTDTNDAEHSGCPNLAVVSKNSTILFWSMLSWNCGRYQRSWRYQKAVYSPFCMNICQWGGCVQSECCVCSQLNKNALTIQSFVCNTKEILHKYVTMDETWIHHFTPKSNQQSAEWTAAGESQPKMQMSAGKVLACVFWDVQNYMNCASNCFQTHPILQIWPPPTSGCLQRKRFGSNKEVILETEAYF